MEGGIDYMLSPDRLSADGIFPTSIFRGAESRVASLLETWRGLTEPFFPEGGELAESVIEKWHAAQDAARLNPMPPEFFDRLRDLREALDRLRRVAQAMQYRGLRWRRKARRLLPVPGELGQG